MTRSTTKNSDATASTSGSAATSSGKTPAKKGMESQVPYVKGPVMDWSMNDELYSRFKTWKLECEIIFDSAYASVTESIKVNTLLRWSGQFGIQKFQSWGKDRKDLSLEFMWSEFESYCKPASNILRARYDLLKKLSQSNKPCDDWFTILQNQLQLCNYSTETEEVLRRDLFLFGLDHEGFMTKIISEEPDDISTETIRQKLKKLESGRATAKYIKGTSAVSAVPASHEVNFTKQQFSKCPRQNNKSRNKRKKPSGNGAPPPAKKQHAEPQQHQQPSQQKSKPYQQSQPYHGQQNQRQPQHFQRQQKPKECTKCGDTPHMQGFECPASRWQCKNCKKYGHFTSKCFHQKTNSVNLLTEEKEFLQNWEINNINSPPQVRAPKRLFANLPLVNQHHHSRRTYLRTRLDLAADVNLMPVSAYVKLTGDKDLKQLGPIRCKMTTYTKDAIKNLGSVCVFVKYPGQPTVKLDFNVTNQEGSTLICCQDLLSLGLVIPKSGLEDVPADATVISSQVDANQKINNVDKTTPIVRCKEDIRKHFSDCLDGLGKFPGQPYHINVDPNVVPVRVPCRKVDIHFEAEFKKQLNQMLQAGVIVPQNEPTPWINSFVIVHAKDKIRICLDPTNLNKAVIREPYHYRTPSDIFHKLSNAKFFTVIDLKKGYWQIPLDEESSYLTTFNTPFGRFRFTRVPFGITVSGDAFQRKIDNVYMNIDQAKGIADDMLIWGNKEDGSDHDEALTEFLQTTRRNNLCINYEKIQYKMKSVSFFGKTLTTDGHKPHDDHVRAIVEMDTPTNVTNIQTIMGMIQFSAEHSPRIAEISEPLRQLTCKDVAWNWGPEHDEALKALKKEISTAPVLGYYNPKKELVLQTDASTKGLGAVLLQEGKPIYFASKSLTPCQKNYVAIELEALAVNWAVQKFHHYLYGKHFTLETDHKPLESILNRSLQDAPKRLQRLLMVTLPYDMTVKYIKGATNVIADCLSRSPVDHDTIQLPRMQINLVTQDVPCKADKLHKLRLSTSRDETLVLLKAVVQQGWPDRIQNLPPELKPYWTFREQITIEDGLLLKDRRIIVPDCDRDEILSQIHRGHLGLQKCLQRARASVYWPKLYDQLKELVTNCKICLKFAPANRPDQIGPSLGQEVPTTPWTKLASDIFTWQNQNFLILVDYMSRFPVVRKLSSMTADCVTGHLTSIFNEFGPPETIVTDNGPCYNSETFRTSMIQHGVHHITTSPHYHQSNGLAEGYVKIVKNLFNKAHEEGQNVLTALRIYRSTPLSADLPSPFELLFNRPPDSDLPQMPRHSSAPVRTADKHPEAADSQILPPRSSVMYITPPDKIWKPAKVVEYLGYRSYRIQAENGAKYVRSRYHLRPYTPHDEQLQPPRSVPENQPLELRRTSRPRRAPDRMDL